MESARRATEEDGGTKTRPSAREELPKSPTGIEGLDEITGGGLPRGRPTLLCGAAGCGKTLLAMEFLVRGATRFGEPGVFMAFEETADELVQNVRSLGFDADRLVRRRKLVIDHVRVERSEIQETGEYDLEGLSSLIDTWLLLRDIELQGERNRVLYVLKSRGMNHSNQVREFVLTNRGVDVSIVGDLSNTDQTLVGLQLRPLAPG